MASSLWAAEGSKSRLSETIFNINNLTSLVLPEGMNKKESSSQRKQKWDVLSFDHMLPLCVLLIISRLFYADAKNCRAINALDEEGGKEWSNGWSIAKCGERRRRSSREASVLLLQCSWKFPSSSLMICFGRNFREMILFGSSMQAQGSVVLYCSSSPVTIVCHHCYTSSEVAFFLGFQY